MPRVSDEHLAARRQQILDAARVCFSRDGFHATSMQDVIAEAGLSVGAVYRYFKSKQELVMSIAMQVLSSADDVFAEIMSHDPPLPLADAVDRALEFVDRQTEPDGVFRIAIQVWSEALRDPELAAFVRARYTQFRGYYAAIARRAQEVGELPPDADIDAVGAALFGLIPAYALQRILADGPDRKTYAAAVRTLLMR
ncbi:TetR/AcrR family transcriptional regulator [Phytohabitans aurantiacus]|jgi:AcrR family transcriptional regulator|uniref:TetR family transcriptional regulator n=1 Tax=Phytohabitans aurantiacus TaxID=3016789 RepID=A0ABQ5QV30_9ACTN|nr:TetR/AcrR family transcriptional regulator [Phytohabitans aurantiacus]GLH98274.1 TetR family transcriptional regulator [Phytohabitans aurantiacus]